MSPDEKNGPQNTNNDKPGGVDREYNFSGDTSNNQPIHTEPKDNDAAAQPKPAVRSFDIRSTDNVESKPVSEPVASKPQTGPQNMSDVAGPMQTEFTPQSTAAPQYQQPVAAPAKEPANAGLIILQWLTYAFWGWTVLALSILTTSVVASFIEGGEGNPFSSYGIAAVLVLLPISYICDSFYAKKEPIKKVGAETIVMVIHAVLFALFGIGALITAVISLVVLFTSGTGSKGALITLISALIIAGFYALTFVRTLNPSMLRRLQHKYKLIMLITVGLIAVLGLVGPVANERATRDDRLIEAELPTLSRAIEDYSRDNNKLPVSLGDLDLRGDTTQLVTRNLVEYNPVTTANNNLNTNTFNLNNGRTGSSSSRSLNTLATNNPVTYRYELCVRFKKESNDRYGYSGDSWSKDSDGYMTYLSVYDHPAGRVCYKLKTADY